MIDRKNAILILCVCLLLAVVGIVIPYFQYQTNESNQVTSSNIPSGGSTVRIDYTNKGFDPPLARIPIGTTVVWANFSEKPMWVASDPHPSHTDHNGFDQRSTNGNREFDEGIGVIPKAHAHQAQGTIYEYTFTATGTFKYHNHIIPSDRGTIIVN